MEHKMNNQIKKVIRDGKVAVLFSPGFGAGWSTWNLEYADEMMFDPGLVKLIEDKANNDTIDRYIEDKFPDVYAGGSNDLKIAWIPIGDKFLITEYDGSESIITPSEGYWNIA